MMIKFLAQETTGALDESDSIYCVTPSWTINVQNFGYAHDKNIETCLVCIIRHDTFIKYRKWDTILCIYITGSHLIVQAAEGFF